MAHSDFVHLHVHTQYSLLDGACLIKSLVSLASLYRMNSLAMTDHGNMFGAIEFYEHAMKHGVKPIIGCEVYVAPESRFEKTSHGINEASFHLVLLAKDEQGYKNLMKLVSIGYLEGFYYKPRIDMEVLNAHSKGLVALSSCLQGEIPHLIMTDQFDQAKKLAGKFNEIFGKDNFYLELQDHSIPEQNKVNQALIKMSGELALPLVCTNDVHYLQKDHARAHEALLCIQTQTTLEDPNRMRFQTDEFYLKSGDEMKKLFKDAPESCTNTLKIAEMCNLELDFSKTHLPHFSPPEGKTREAYLKELVYQGLDRRYAQVNQDIKNRVEHELESIKESGFISYFLIAWDFVRYAKDNKIPTGPGRGSAAGSVVSYALGITDIDPLRYDLLFERFINPERVSLPDIDIDFCYERRNEVINYVASKYGKENVAQIVTFGTMGAKAVIRDVARAMNIPYSEADRIAKLVPNDLNITLEEALKQEQELDNLYKNDSKITQLIEISKALEGLTRHASTHAAGVVISEKPLVNYIPLYKTTEEQLSTGYPMESLEKVGLMKMDFLGLRTLTVIDETTKIINRIKGIEIKTEEMPLDDKKTYELLAKAESVGVFQLESSGMRDLLRKLQPNKFEDLIALLALFRPGPIGTGMVDDFIKRKHGKIRIVYDHPLLEPILKDTYGVCVFQEQVMKIVNVLAGFSLSQADILRRAISKKIPEVMEEQRKHFIAGCVKRNVNREVAEKIFDQIEYFSGYAFNKSHSAAYAMISYRTAYLKANYPVEFMTALLTSERDNTDKVAQYIDESKRMGIKILPPDVNESFGKFTVVQDSVRFGLSAVKNVGQGAVDSIIQARQDHGKFASIYELCERIDTRLVNRKVIESLIKCGACDNFNLYRSQMVAVLDHALEAAGGIQKDRFLGQYSFLDKFEGQEGFKNTFQGIPNIKEWPENQLLSFEKEMLGFYITGHPLARFEKTLRMYESTSTVMLGKLKDGDEVSVGGVITKLKHTVTKRLSEKMAIVSIEDLDGDVEVLVFPSTYKTCYQHLKKEAIVFLKGRVNLREEIPKIVANEIIPIDEVRQKYTKSLTVNLFSAGLEDANLENLKLILKRHSGEIPVYLNINSANSKKVKILVDKDFYVKATDEFFAEIENALGENSLIVNKS